MNKEYIVELREEEANELMEEHWVGELVRCKDCQYLFSPTTFPLTGVPFCKHIKKFVSTYWFCADGEQHQKAGEVE